MSDNDAFEPSVALRTGLPEDRPSLARHDGLSPPPLATGPWAERAALARRAISRARTWLLDRQDPAGYWCGELEGDSILQSEYILLLAHLGRERCGLARKCAQRLLDTQLVTGGWSQYPGGALDVSASVKAYFALKLTGHEPSSEPLTRARRAILAAGGADRVNSFTRFYLALLGQIPYSVCPVVPPELVLLPRWFPVNLYAMSAWSRTIVVPLAIMSALKPVTHLDPELGIRELFREDPSHWPKNVAPDCAGRKSLWTRFFHAVDSLLHRAERWRILPFRRRALAAAERWMLERFSNSDGLGAIFPPIVWSVIALRARGYADDSPEVAECLAQLDALVIEDDESARLQPCKSPVWDTALALRAIQASGVSPEHPAQTAAVDWLLDREVRTPGDWRKTVRAESGGWCFEFANEFYPDVDDTAMVLIALAPPRTVDTLAPELRVAQTERPVPEDEARQTAWRIARRTEAIDRGGNWLLAMQNRDGGWGAFDRNNDREFLCHVPFADHNAMIDPSTPDITARALEALGRLGHRTGEPAIDRALAYLRRTQEPDGSWFGRWGVNYIYGTWQVLAGLREIGVPADDPMMTAGAQWLVAFQHPSGGWGESADTYERPELRGQGPATASQTAWAVLGLLAAGWADHAAVTRGVEYLARTQSSDGTWPETEFTGTGFPRVFYLRYHLYPHYFPLLALSQFAHHATLLSGEPPATIRLR